MTLALGTRATTAVYRVVNRVVLLMTHRTSARWWSSHAQKLGAFAGAAREERYVVTGVYVAHELPQNAVLITVLHSGIVRSYGHRTSVQWTEIAPGNLAGAIALLNRLGLTPFVLVDGDEVSAFRTRFANEGSPGKLDWPAQFEYDGVYIYALDRVPAL